MAISVEIFLVIISTISLENSLMIASFFKVLSAILQVIMLVIPLETIWQFHRHSPTL